MEKRRTEVDACAWAATFLCGASNQPTMKTMPTVATVIHAARENLIHPEMGVDSAVSFEFVELLM